MDEPDHGDTLPDITDGVLVIQTGGTIDKDYPKTILGYAFEISEPAVPRILSRVNPSLDFKHVTACRKDSQDITEEDRNMVADLCKESKYSKILITHGTDTMIETASYLSPKILNKTIVLTGAFLPETFKNSDADFNVGFALGALQCLSEPGVYIAMNGCISHWSKCKRDPVTNMFTRNM